MAYFRAEVPESAPAPAAPSSAPEAFTSTRFTPAPAQPADSGLDLEDADEIEDE